eukprot:1414996-Prymnesium_polylepis.1
MAPPCCRLPGAKPPSRDGSLAPQAASCCGSLALQAPWRCALPCAVACLVLCGPAAVGGARACSASSKPIASISSMSIGGSGDVAMRALRSVSTCARAGSGGRR